MLSQDEIKHVIAKNLIKYRKKNGYTQLDIANLLNYTDKAISKWERAESLPDIAVLKQLADIYNITLDELTTETPEKEIPDTKIGKLLNSHKLIIPILSAGLVWLVATIFFVFLTWFTDINRVWLAFIYAIPVSLIVLIVFNAIWGNPIVSAVIISFLVWSIPLAGVLSIDISNKALLFAVGAPLQVLVILWYFMKVHSANLKKRNKRKNLRISENYSEAPIIFEKPLNDVDDE